MQLKTNYALITALLEMDGPQVVQAVDTERSMVSRWKNGTRQITPGGHWAYSLADAFLSRDSAGARPFVAYLLADVYPIGILAGKELQEKLAAWLAASRQDRKEEFDRRMDLFLKYTAYLAGREVPLPGSVPKAAHGALAQVVVGYAQTQQAIAGAVEYIGTLKEPEQFTFVCTEGIDIITKYENYRDTIMKILMHTLGSGHTVNVVLRTDFKMSDVTTFVGPWFAAHLMGYIKSWYYDDFRQVETDGTILFVKGVMALHIMGEEYRCETYTDKENPQW